MRKLTKMLLIHWYGYTREVIEFDRINFLTGNTGSGKSTVIDALQLVMLGDTTGTFFNKAANEKSDRTLRSYLFGENGDDGDTGFRYLRQGSFSSYVVLEFEHQERDQHFSAGIVCDCHADLNYEYKWFVLHRDEIPADLFCDPDTNTPYDIAGLRRYLKSSYGKNQYEIIDTNKRFQLVMLGKYGQMKQKYLQLLKRAVPFQPLSNIEQFITQSICDVKNDIHVEQMQSDIRVYRNLEADAGRISKRIDSLSEIHEVSERYDAGLDKLNQQSYVADRAEKEEYLTEEDALKKRTDEHRDRIRANQEEMASLQTRVQDQAVKIGELEKQYYASDLRRRQEELEREIRELSGQITYKESLIQSALNALHGYGAEWTAQETALKKTGFLMQQDEKLQIDAMRMITEKDLTAFPFSEAASVQDQMAARIRLQAEEYKRRHAQLVQDIEILREKKRNLEKGIKPYPDYVMRTKRALEKGIFDRCKKSVEAKIFADLIEIRDISWQDAIEGYLDRQKFYLLIPEDCYQDALQIYHALRKEENIYDAGLVDIGKLRKHYNKKVAPDSLAVEIETDDPDARLYADYLLGQVHKCEDVTELNRYPVSITKNVMLYKSFVTRKIPPRRYENPFIGRRSMELQLARVAEELKASQTEAEDCAAVHRILQKAAGVKTLQSFEAQKRNQEVLEAADLPEIRKRLAQKKEEFDAIDFTWLTHLEEDIRREKNAQAELDQRFRTLEKENVRRETEIEGIERERMPAVIEKLNGITNRINAAYDEDWIRMTGEPRYLREQKGQRTSLSLRESFRREATRTRNELERLQNERMKLREHYNLLWKMPFDSTAEHNREYDAEWKKLDELELPRYIEQIKDARIKAYEQFRDDFIAKMKSNIETVKEQVKELNDSLRHSVFGTDRYRFTVRPRAEYQRYYDMITDPMLMDTGGWNLASRNFNTKYQKEIDELFHLLILEDMEASAARRREYEANVKKFTDYRTYLVFDLIVTNDQGEEQRLSKTLLKKSGGETQIPFYIAMLASFSQVCRIRSKGKDDTLRLIILDEAFSKMDGERIRECIPLLRRFGLQAVFSAPPEKIPEIAPLVDRNIAVYKDGHRSFTRFFAARDVEEIISEMDE